MSEQAPTFRALATALACLLLGAAMVWECLVALRRREGDFDRQLAPWMYVGAMVGLVLSALLAVSAAAWLLRWGPEFVLW